MTREELLDQIRKQCWDLFETGRVYGGTPAPAERQGWVGQSDVDEVVDAIMALFEQQAPRWIPVTAETEFESNMPVLAWLRPRWDYRPEGEYAAVVYPAVDGTFWCCDLGFKRNELRYYMPLPEPPKER